MIGLGDVLDQGRLFFAIGTICLEEKEDPGRPTDLFKKRLTPSFGLSVHRLQTEVGDRTALAFVNEFVAHAHLFGHLLKAFGLVHG